MRIILPILLIIVTMTSMTCQYGLKFDNQKVTDATLVVYGRQSNRIDSLGSVGAYDKGQRFLKLDGTKNKVRKQIASYDSIIVMSVERKPGTVASRWSFSTKEILEDMKPLVLQ